MMGPQTRRPPLSDQGKPTPLADALAEDAPAWTDFAGWHMAARFEGVVAEHQAVRNGAGLFDISHMGRLELAGDGADAAVDRLLTRRTADMTPGAIRYAFICSAGGCILDDLMVARIGQNAWQLVVNAANRERVVAQVRDAGYAALLSDRTEATAMLAVQGPRSAELLAGVWPQSRATDRRRYRRWTGELGQHALVGSRSGYTGEDGFELFGPPEAVAALWRELRCAGAAPCGLGARDALRNEAALPLYGHELREASSPWELGLAYAVDLATDFIGRDPLAARREAGIRRRRVGLVLAGRRIARETMAVFREGAEVGEVTSGTWSPGRDAPIAQAMIQADSAEPGAAVEIDVRGRREAATVVALAELMPRKSAG